MKRGNEFQKMVDDVFTHAKEKGIFHLNAEDDRLNGRTIKIQGQEVINFGSCSYLGLEMHPLLKQGVIDAVERYGTQFSSSRSYVSSPFYEELEELFEQIFDAPALVAPTTTLAHLAAIPVLIQEGDAVIVDHQTHNSVNMALNRVRLKGTPVELVRHNRLDLLEKRIRELGKKYQRVWYMIDGVYSMYGDLAPMRELETMLNDFPQLYLYVDDAHGMSWCGKHGRGYSLSRIPFHEKMILATSLAKGFGVGGGVLLFPNAELKRKVRTCGETLIFSGPIQPPMLGACLAGARLHLSPEIEKRQLLLEERISYCNELLGRYDLPVIASTETPIRFIGAGLLRVGYNLVARLLREGFYTNIGLFPAVPIKCSGLRFTLTLHQSLKDIENLVQTLAWHLPQALEEEERTKQDIYSAFKLTSKNSPLLCSRAKGKNRDFSLESYSSIQDLNRKEWDSLLGTRGSFTAEGLQFLENTFCENSSPEHNWKFHYYLIRDRNRKPLLATFFTESLWKEDMLSSKAVSYQIEKLRQQEPYFLTSKILMMGSIMTEGNHLFLDRTRKDWREIFMLFLEKLWEDQEKTGASSIALRDFPTEDLELSEFLFRQGFLKISMPHAHVLENSLWKTKEEFLEKLSHKTRYHQKRYVFPFSEKYIVKVFSAPSYLPSEEELDRWYGLYQNVASRKRELNVFLFPKKLFRNMTRHHSWETICLFLKEDSSFQLPVSVGFCFKSPYGYYPTILGMDYRFLETHGCYRQSIWQTIQRGKELNLPKTFLGMTASLEKRRFGAVIKKNHAFFQTKDNFNLSLLSQIQVTP